MSVAENYCEYTTRWRQQNIMQEDRLIAIYDILNSLNTYEKELKFKLYRQILGDCKIFLFDEEASNLGEAFKNYEIGKCGIYGVGDYTKTWIMDSRYPEDTRYLQCGKTVDFDLNIFTYLNKIMRGMKINEGIDRGDVIVYFNYIKEKGFQFGIVTAIMERVTKPLDFKILFEMLTSYVQYDKIKHIDKTFKKVHLNIFDYHRVCQLYRITKEQINEFIPQYDAVCCCVMKAYLIKNYDKEKKLNRKVDKFIYYCLHVLNCYMEKEIVLLALYILEDNRTKETFKKLNKTSNIEEQILNVTWDIYHLRLIEQIMLHDNVGRNEQIILSYFATADKGVIDAMKINPVKAFIILDDYSIVLHSIRIDEICQNKDILAELFTMSAERKEMAKTTDYAEIKKQLQKEIQKLQ